MTQAVAVLRQRWIIVALVAMFAVLSLVVEIDGEMPGDDWVLSELYDAVGTDLDDLMVGVGAATDTVPLIGLWAGVVVVMLAADRRPEAVVFLVTVVAAMAGNSTLKQLFARARPDVRVSPETVSTFSYPSGHAANSLAFAGALWLIAPTPAWRRRTAIAGAIFVALVGFSRIAISVHYPSDILAAWCWVGAWVIAVSMWWNRHGDRLPVQESGPSSLESVERWP